MLTLSLRTAGVGLAPAMLIFTLAVINAVPT